MGPPSVLGGRQCPPRARRGEEDPQCGDKDFQEEEGLLQVRAAASEGRCALGARGGQAAPQRQAALPGGPKQPWGADATFVGKQHPSTNWHSIDWPAALFVVLTREGCPFVYQFLTPDTSIQRQLAQK